MKAVIIEDLVLAVTNNSLFLNINFQLLRATTTDNFLLLSISLVFILCSPRKLTTSFFLKITFQLYVAITT